MGKSKLIPFDAADYLQSEEDMALYLNAVLEDGSPEEIAAALVDIARARGMARVAADAGLSRESLYRGLSGERIPSADTLLRVIRGACPNFCVNGFEINLVRVALRTE